MICSLCSPSVLQSLQGIRYLFPSPGNFYLFPALIYVFLSKNSIFFQCNVIFLETDICFPFIMPSPKNLDLFSNDDVISWNGETDDCKETILPRNYHLFPNFSIESYLLERNRYFGETPSLAASVSIF